MEFSDKQHFKTDIDHASKIEEMGIHDYPVDIPSLVLQIYHSEEQPFLSDGYAFKDKPHRVVADCIKEIRKLRKKIVTDNQNEK